MDTTQNNEPQNNSPQNDTSQNNTPQNDDKKQTKKQTIAGIIGGLIVIIFLVNLCSGDGYDPQNAPFGDEENLAYHKKYCNSRDRNNGYACNQVGIKYIKMRDKNNGILYYEKGCNLKFGTACLNLGNTYLNNDNIKAAEYFKKACDYGHYDEGEGCYLFGALHLNKDKSITFEYYKKACDKHYGEGCYAVGLHYAAGEGVIMNMTTAKDYFKKGCKYGHKSSCNELR